MKNRSGIYSTLSVLFSAALLWFGCSARGACHVDSRCAPPPTFCKAPCAVVDEPCEPCNACVTPIGLPSRNQLCSTFVENCGVRVTAKQPQMCMQGDNYILDIEVSAQRDVCDVSIHAMLPEGVYLVRSSPEALLNNGRQITWNIDGMRRGECITNRVTLRADREGEMCVCFCVTAVPVQFCTVLCSRPHITCSKVGPCEVGLCDPVNYCVTVTNDGSCPAEDVVVIDQIPPELEHSSGQRTLTYKLGCIEPCQTKKFNICLTAARIGRACNTIIVTSCNANQCTDTFCTLVTQCGIDLEKSGPKEVKIGGTATYDLVVTNIGNKLLNEVVVTDCVPQSTTIVDAKGAQVNGNQALWKFRELRPGDKQNLQLTVTSCTPGFYVNRAQVSTLQGCCARAEAGTRWKGTPGLNVQIVNPEGPVCIGDATTYYIRVVNQGTEEDQNVSVVVRFPNGILPLQASGATPGKITNGTVTFVPANILGPRQTLEFRIDAVAREPGDSRIKVEVSSDTFKTPIIQEESTIVS